MTNSQRLRAAPPNLRHPLTVERISLAVIASAQVYGVDPAAALTTTMGSHRRACVPPAALALALATGQQLKDVCRLLQCRPTAVAAAKAKSREVFTNAFEAAQTAVRATIPADQQILLDHGRDIADIPGQRPVPGRLTADSVRLPASPSPSGPALLAARAAVESEPATTPRKKGASVAKAISESRMARVIRMNPVTPRKLRYARRFLQARWDLEEVAYLFDVSADALADALNPVAA